MCCIMPDWIQHIQLSYEEVCILRLQTAVVLLQPLTVGLAGCQATSAACNRLQLAGYCCYWRFTCFNQQ